MSVYLHNIPAVYSIAFIVKLHPLGTIVNTTEWGYISLINLQSYN